MFRSGCSLVGIALVSLLSGTGLLCAQESASGAFTGWAGGREYQLGRNDSDGPLTCWIDPEILDPRSSAVRILVTTQADQPVALDQVKRLQEQIAVSNRADVRWVWTVLPAGMSFPPQGPAYHTDHERSSAAVWRALAWLGIDAVVELIPEQEETWPAESLSSAASTVGVNGYGTVSAARIPVDLLSRPIADWSEAEQTVTQIPQVLPLVQESRHSALATEFHRRQARTPRQVAEELSQTYGHQFKTIMYQPALAVIARLWLNDLEESPELMPEISRLVEPDLKKYADDPQLQPKVNGSVAAGHLLFVEWALRTGDPRATEAVRRAAAMGFDASGQPRETMPAHNEMSDAVFMGCPILTGAARLTDEAKYLDLMETHLNAIQKFCLRNDGLYRHSPLCEAAWGRGNGFPMLGLALAIPDLEAIRNDLASPLQEQAGKLSERCRRDFLRHATVLIKYQDATGAFRQVIDEPSAYREMTATCMIGFALQRGIQQGWLDAGTFEPACTRAWNAVLPRMATDGVLLDVCTGTGKQPSLQAYYDRTAIFDRDERGGAMALIFAVERARAGKP